MYLTDEQQAILNGSKGETMAKVMKTLVMYGDTFGAEKMVPVTSQYNHLVTSFGLKMMKPVFELMQQLIDAGTLSQQKFSVDPRPLDKNVPANFLMNFIFNNFMYSKQEEYEKQLQSLGLITKIPLPAPAIWTRWAISPRRVKFSAGQNPPPWSMPILSWVPGATATPVSWTLWVPSPVLFPPSVC